MKLEPFLIVSCPSLERLTKAVGEYFFSDKIRIEGEAIYNGEKHLTSFRAIQKRGRWRLEQIQ